MEIQVVDRNVRTAGMGKPVSFAIKKEHFGFISSILSDKLYSDKIGAVVREYLCNGIDANRRSGTSKNILITLPTQFESIVKFRDFGLGLSEEFILERFIMFGDSDKRGSNDEIGTFGLGAKAGFAYTDSFVITSWYEGNCYTYSAQKAANGELQLYVISCEPSDEPSGIEIAISVEDYEIASFKSKIAEFCKYANVKFDFASPFEVPQINYLCKFDKFFIEKSVNSWSHRPCRVIMGNVVYPILTDQVKEEFRGLQDIMLYAEIGDLDVNPNRESLEYTPKTKDFLNGLFAEIMDTVKSDTQKKIDAKKHPWEVHSLITDLNASFNRSMSFKTKDFTFKGRAIDYSVEEVKHYLRLNTKYMCRHHKFGIDNIDANTVIVIAQEDTPIYPSRLSQGYFAKYGVWPSKILVSDDKDVYQKIFCDDWKPEQIIVDYKSMWAKVKRSSGGTHIVDPNTYVYKNRDRWDCCKIGDVKADKNYVICNGPNLEIADFNDREFVDSSRQLGLTFYAIKKHKAKHLDSSWIPLKDATVKFIEAKIKGFNTKDYLTAQEIGSVNKIGYVVQFVERQYKALAEAGENQVLEIIKKYNRVKNACSGSAPLILALAKKYSKEISLEKTQELVDEVNTVKAFCKKYELGIRIYEHVNYYQYDSFRESIEGYIKLINPVLVVDNKPQM